MQQATEVDVGPQDFGVLEMFLVAADLRATMNADEGANVGGSFDLHEHLDIAIVMLILIALFVYGFGAVGRYAGNSLNTPGVTAFFGG